MSNTIPITDATRRGAIADLFMTFFVISGLLWWGVALYLLITKPNI